jgi:predicted Fe-S protein YdhL (DUF1289 family)
MTDSESLERTIARARVQQPVGSPCTDICKLNRETGYCEGCFRTRDEIKAWKTMADADKVCILDGLLARRASSMEGASRLLRQA